MVFNNDTGVYEKTLFLKQGYYNYNYATIDRGMPNGRLLMKAPKATSRDTENDYTISCIIKHWLDRADELVGITYISSLTGRKVIGQ